MTSERWRTRFLQLLPRNAILGLLIGLIDTYLGIGVMAIGFLIITSWPRTTDPIPTKVTNEAIMLANVYMATAAMLLHLFHANVPPLLFPYQEQFSFAVMLACGFVAGLYATRIRN